MKTSLVRPKKAISKAEIFNCKRKAYISAFDAGEKKEYALTFRSEGTAYEFVTRLRKVLKEVAERGHYMNEEKIALFVNPAEGRGWVTFNDDKFEFRYSERTDPKQCHETLSKLIWGDSAD